MLVGLDFDNTIVCYDRLFHKLAVERGLIPTDLPVTKQSVRDALRSGGRETDWTELQGIAYGARITDAELFPGVKHFLARCRAAGVQVAIISHKTQYPFRGARHDLHAAAHAFLQAQGLFQTWDTGLAPDRTYLELTLAGKLSRVGSLGCAAFIDDLPELLAEPAFPAGVWKLLFDPAGVHADGETYTRVTSWDACADALLSRQEALA